MLRHSTAHVLAEAVSTSTRAPRSRSGRRSTTASTTTSSSRTAARRGRSRAHRGRDARILAAGPHPIERSLTTRDEAISRFQSGDEPYKVELAEDLARGEEITEYTQDGFVDLCRGPHLQDTKPIRAFKLTSLAGAYWRGDSRNTHAHAHLRHRLLQPRRSSRSTCTGSRRRSRRDHRRLGAQLDLFHFSDVSPGSPFWHPQGDGDLERADGLLARAERAARLPRGADAASSSTPSCGSARGTGTTTARTCSSVEADERVFGLSR